jgi:hypothetical protein
MPALGRLCEPSLLSRLVDPANIAAAVRLPAEHRLAIVPKLETQTFVVVVELVERAARDDPADMRDQ